MTPKDMLIEPGTLFLERHCSITGLPWIRPVLRKGSHNDSDHMFFSEFQSWKKKRSSVSLKDRTSTALEAILQCSETFYKNVKILILILAISPISTASPESLQKQVSVMSINLSAKLDELQRGDRQLETTVALCEIRSQLQELTKSVESCQSEVSEVKRDMVAIKHELDTVQQVKEEIEELREYVDRLGEQSHRRKLRLLEQGLTFFLSYAILAAMLGMLQFGYNTGVINAPEVSIENFMKDVYKDRYGEDIQEDYVKLLYAVAVSIFAIGGMLGGFSGGMIANRFGRKGGLLLNNILGIGGACLMGFTKIAHSYEVLFLGRFIIGVNCGLNTSLVPMYISEIAPLNLRGGLGTVNQLAVTIGLLMSQVLGIEQILGTDDGWPVLLGLAVCPAILQLILLPVCPESPRYLLITKQWEEEARKALRRLRASNQVEEDIEEMRAEERAQSAEATISMKELICSPTLRAPLIIGVVMQLSQQLSGINAVFYYSTGLFISSGLTEESAKFATIGIGAIMVGMTIVSIPLMDRTGRRTLHLYGLGGMFIFSIFITISFLIKVCKLGKGGCPQGTCWGVVGEDSVTLQWLETFAM
uniref:Major facilitator superfamily (MFS) profile domain-containing protein n=1 Tax=Timema cristinae TaxID=61476 RepID=A0A7R9H1E2_TIMCR|nr:unnamed protein product [Timema cristinae]